MSDNPVGKPLPKTVFDLMSQRKGRFERTLNDIVEESYLKLFEDAAFRRFLEGVSDSECLEGSESCDDHEAAKMIREYLRKENSPYGNKPIHSFKIALKVVLRRYNQTRKERRLTVGGVLQEAAE